MPSGHAGEVSAMPVDHVNGVELYWEQRGSGPRLLFCNGSGPARRDHLPDPGWLRQLRRDRTSPQQHQHRIAHPRRRAARLQRRPRVLVLRPGRPPGIHRLPPSTIELTGGRRPQDPPETYKAVPRQGVRLRQAGDLRPRLLSLPSRVDQRQTGHTYGGSYDPAVRASKGSCLPRECPEAGLLPLGVMRSWWWAAESTRGFPRVVLVGGTGGGGSGGPDGGRRGQGPHPGV
jgi:hypothetical protein